ncbi:hypothetical protein GCM10009504_12590 [Pseudomonas laurentiana]|uniref:Helix-turn-helix transcriptional regulator n=1 Tax=Pseudomonas laurentiana TaxID=2364649 RepID=A0A6I5RRI9_9PSED|nr:helix-turn-helix transcriptional regulator [Pseudomonas laurentiana]NES10523.1 helix-turn-helix transcriptional regulator [Pseudomonas laurentiana]GGU57062.1 hypothetical protein GCM10009504_12590 [Pseudomonas laurentiana]
MTISSLGPAIKRYRKVAGLTQADLGEKTGFDPKTISRFETGSYTPSVEALFNVVHKATPKDLGKLIAAVDMALSRR